MHSIIEGKGSQSLDIVTAMPNSELQGQDSDGLASFGAALCSSMLPLRISEVFACADSGQSGRAAQLARRSKLKPKLSQKQRSEAVLSSGPAASLGLEDMERHCVPIVHLDAIPGRLSTGNPSAVLNYNPTCARNELWTCEEQSRREAKGCTCDNREGQTRARGGAAPVPSHGQSGHRIRKTKNAQRGD